ncbi:MAG TPA: glycosyltransferase family 4 protein [Candidatus Microsaccharimonas sp.]|nr:glycosyltransferase family 4 protein [Candidatus Microsaccharimonas sp.]
MKIAVVFDDGLDKPDGVQQCILTLNNWLTKQGHEVHYIVGETKRTDIPNVHVAARNIPVKFNGNRLTIPLPTSQAKLKTLLDEIQPDILHVHVPYSPFMGAKAIKAASPIVGVVGTFHVLPYGFVARYGTRLLGLWLRSSLRRFNALYAGTSAAAAFATWSMHLPTGTLPHPVNVAAFQTTKPAQRSDRLQVVFLGRLVARKGALQLVQAIAGLSTATKSKIQVHLGGRGEQLDVLARLIETHHLQDIISMDGFISEAAKPSYLAQADIAIFPSISGESFGISLLEPMAAGAGVVVGGNNPGYASVLGAWPETLFDPTDTPAFTTYLEELINNSQLRATIHASQQAAIKQYDVTLIGQEWLKIYQHAIAAQAQTAKH